MSLCPHCRRLFVEEGYMITMQPLLNEMRKSIEEDERGVSTAASGHRPTLGGLTHFRLLRLRTTRPCGERRLEGDAKGLVGQVFVVNESTNDVTLPFAFAVTWKSSFTRKLGAEPVVTNAKDCPNVKDCGNVKVCPPLPEIRRSPKSESAL